jgi:hypothetical protein
MRETRKPEGKFLRQRGREVVLLDRLDCEFGQMWGLEGFSRDSKEFG